MDKGPQGDLIFIFKRLVSRAVDSPLFLGQGCDDLEILADNNEQMQASWTRMALLAISSKYL